MYDELASDHPIDLTRYQVANCYMGRIGLINSGGASGDNDLAQAVRTAVINCDASPSSSGASLRIKAITSPRPASSCTSRP